MNASHYVCERTVQLGSDRFSQPNYTAVASTCNLWRTGDDVDDSWHSVSDIIDFYAGNQGGFAQVAGPGARTRLIVHALSSCWLLIARFVIMLYAAPSCP